MRNNPNRFRRWTDKQLAQIPKELHETLNNPWKERRVVREKIWKEIALLWWQWKLPFDAFSRDDINRMRRWWAPTAPEDQQLPWNNQVNKRYHIHHKTPRHRWWSNNMSNLVIVSPRMHHEWKLLDDKTHYWSWFSR